MKPLSILLIIVSLYSTVLGQTPLQIHGALSVKGNQIVNETGDAVSLAGNSLFWSNTGWGGEAYYNASVIDWLHTDWNTSVVRAAMGVEDNGGYISDASNKEKVKAVVDAAIEAGIYVIIDWHSHHAEAYETEAIEFFKEMASLYGDKKNVIYEIYNEPLNNVSWNNTIKPYAESVIAAIRSIDSDNLIIVGTPTWSQDVDVASKNPIKGYANIAYALHFYAGTHGQFLRDKAQTALDNGIAIIVSEWGAVEASGDGAVDQVETALWMDFLRKNKISHCNWALNDKKEGASSLKVGASKSGNWTASDLTSSGVLVKDIIKNWNSSYNAPVGIIDSNPKNVDFELYPNPTHDLLFFKTPEDVQIISIAIFNTLGSKIIEIYNPANTLDLSTISAGTHYVSVQTNKGALNKRLIIE